MSRSGVVSRYSVAIWLRDAERETEGVDLPPFDPTELEALVPDLLQLTVAPVFAWAVERAKELMNGARVGIPRYRGRTGAPASGAVRWMPRKPVDHPHAEVPNRRPVLVQPIP